MRKLAIIVVVAGLCALAGAGDKGHANLKFVVVKDANGKPVRNASVILHPVNKHGKQEKGGLDRKSTRLNSSHIQKSRMPSSA